MSKHPYFPRSLVLNNYVPGALKLWQILVPLFGLFGVVFLAGLYFGRRLPLSRRLAVAWFALSGIIHSVLEGYFCLYHADIQSRTDIFAEVWKEYSKGDSRYISSDSFTVYMETITALAWGPSCLLTAFGIVTAARWRYVLQTIVSVGQLYGTVLYFVLEYGDNFAHGEANHPLYFWFYFVFMNVVWIIVPLLMIASAWLELTRAQTEIDAVDKKKKKRN